MAIFGGFLFDPFEGVSEAQKPWSSVRNLSGANTTKTLFGYFWNKNHLESIPGKKSFCQSCIIGAVSNCCSMGHHLSVCLEPPGPVQLLRFILLEKSDGCWWVAAA